jgi:putative serine protease PepD
MSEGRSEPGTESEPPREPDDGSAVWGRPSAPPPSGFEPPSRQPPSQQQPSEPPPEPVEPPKPSEHQGFHSPSGPDRPTEVLTSGPPSTPPADAAPAQTPAYPAGYPWGATPPGIDPDPAAPAGHPGGAPAVDLSGPPAPGPDGSFPPGSYPPGSYPPGSYPPAGAFYAQQPRRRVRPGLILLVIAVALVTGLVGGLIGAALATSDGRDATVSLPKPVAGNTGAVTGVTAVAAAVLPSVVSIKVATATEQGTGSGFVIDAAKGYILTNNHVVTAESSATASDIEVVFQDGTQVPGTVVGRDASYDLAVLKVKVKGLRALQFGDSDDVRVGDPVIAIGAPLGLQGTVTTGIVSALNRPVAAGSTGNAQAYINAIQTDAAINPGNSGGPLVDSAGHVIAINSAIATAPGTAGEDSGNIGVGFAIPSDQARRTAEELIRTGHAEHPIIGVSLQSNYEGQGVKVSEQDVNGTAPVSPGGPADRAGIKAGDVITKIDGRPVTEPDELIVAIRALSPGDTVTLTVVRNRVTRAIKVKLSASSN